VAHSTLSVPAGPNPTKYGKRIGFLIASCIAIATIISGCSSPHYIERGNQFYATGKYEDATLEYRNAIKKTLAPARPTIGWVLPSSS
jgi:hypothetical protein